MTSKLKNTLHRLWRLSLAGMDVYALGLGFYFLARFIVGRDWWYTNFMGNLLGWLLIPSFIILPLVLIGRYRWRVLYAGVFVLLFGLMFGELYLPSATSETDAPKIKIMSYNVAMYRMSAEDMLQALEDSDADIIGMTELGVAQQHLIEQELSTEYPYQILNGIDSVTGTGLLSRYPIVESEWVYTNVNSPYLKAVLEFEGVRMDVMVAHPPPPAFRADTSIFTDSPYIGEDLDKALGLLDSKNPTLLIGDFNLTDQNPSYDRITGAGFTDTFRAKGFGLGGTFPNVLPLVRIDYIFVSQHFIPLEASVGEDYGSDHLPIYAEVAFQG